MWIRTREVYSQPSEVFLKPVKREKGGRGPIAPQYSVIENWEQKGNLRPLIYDNPFQCPRGVFWFVLFAIRAETRRVLLSLRGLQWLELKMKNLGGIFLLGNSSREWESCFSRLAKSSTALTPPFCSFLWERKVPVQPISKHRVKSYLDGINIWRKIRISFKITWSWLW